MCNTIVEGHQPPAPPAKTTYSNDVPECGLRPAALTVKIRLNIYYIYIYIYIYIYLYICNVMLLLTFSA